MTSTMTIPYGINDDDYPVVEPLNVGTPGLRCRIGAGEWIIVRTETGSDGIPRRVVRKDGSKQEFLLSPPENAASRNLRKYAAARSIGVNPFKDAGPDDREGMEQ